VVRRFLGEHTQIPLRAAQGSPSDVQLVRVGENFECRLWPVRERLEQELLCSGASRHRLCCARKARAEVIMPSSRSTNSRRRSYRRAGRDV